MKVISHKDLASSDLIIDAVYQGEPGSQLSGEALSSLLPGIGNLGGFRASGKGSDKKFVILYTSGEDNDWPDTLDLSTGQFVYYGDNKRPGHDIHDTSPKGNLILSRSFELLHTETNSRSKIPPFFVFQKYPTEVSSRSAQFKGLAVPGFPGLSATSDLVAVWKSSKGQRFQNYRAVFTILDVPRIERAWLNDLAAGNPLSSNAPEAWIKWVETGKYDLLIAESTTAIRTVQEQLPDDKLRRSILQTICQHFDGNPYAFEGFAARIYQMHDQRVIIDKITQHSVDGGRDAVGRYLLGLSEDPVYARFSLEAKCYNPGLDGGPLNTVGVRDVSRLISRLHHREFGVLVTTSAVGRQAYSEVREDRHPIVFLCGKDIADILVRNGYKDAKSVSRLLSSEFPHRQG